MASRSPNSEELRNELTLLLELQLSSLEKQLFGDITTADILHYERRQERISELYNEVFAKQAPAA